MKPAGLNHIWQEFTDHTSLIEHKPDEYQNSLTHRSFYIKRGTAEAWSKVAELEEFLVHLRKVLNLKLVLE